MISIKIIRDPKLLSLLRTGQYKLYLKIIWYIVTT